VQAIRDREEVIRRYNARIIPTSVKIEKKKEKKREEKKEKEKEGSVKRF